MPKSLQLSAHGHCRWAAKGRFLSPIENRADTQFLEINPVFKLSALKAGRKDQTFLSLSGMSRGHPDCAATAPQWRCGTQPGPQSAPQVTESLGPPRATPACPSMVKDSRDPTPKHGEPVSSSGFPQASSPAPVRGLWVSSLTATRLLLHCLRYRGAPRAGKPSFREVKSEKKTTHVSQAVLTDSPSLRLSTSLA